MDVKRRLVPPELVVHEARADDAPREAEAELAPQALFPVLALVVEDAEDARVCCWDGFVGLRVGWLVVWVVGIRGEEENGYWVTRGVGSCHAGYAPRRGRTGALSTAVQKTRKASHPKLVCLLCWQGVCVLEEDGVDR